MEDLFGNTVADKPVREISKAEAEKAGRISYTRRPRNGPHIGCLLCIQETPLSISPATYNRWLKGESTPLCFQHKQRLQDEERLRK